VQTARPKKTAQKTVEPRKKPASKATPATAAPVESPANWLAAVRAAEDRKAMNIRVLDLREVTSFADFFVLCSGGNQRQVQAICDSVETALKQVGERPNSVEGFSNAEWVLLDYGDMVVHVFSEQARAYYDLDRLWREAREVAIPAAPARP